MNQKVLLVFLVVMMSTFGCKAKKEIQKNHPLEKIKILLDWTPNTNHTGLFVARDLGMYKAQGLDAEIIQSSEGGVAQLIGTEKANFGVSYQEEVTLARLGNIPIKAIAAVIAHNTSGFASPAEKNIKTPKDFEGKRYGGWGSPSEEEVLKGLMEKYNADFKKLIILSIGSSDFFTSVKRDIDFAWIFWGWDGISAELRGIKLNYISLRDEDPKLDYYTPVLIASEKTLLEKQDLVKRFLKATTDGYQYSILNPVLAAQILAKANPEADPVLLEKSQEYLSKQYKDDSKQWGIMDISRWQNYTDWLFDHKLIQNKIDNSKAFTNEFLPIQ